LSSQALKRATEVSDFTLVAKRALVAKHCGRVDAVAYQPGVRVEGAGSVVGRRARRSIGTVAACQSWPETLPTKVI
jgi:hypothetical protein